MYHRRDLEFRPTLPKGSTFFAIAVVIFILLHQKAAHFGVLTFFANFTAIKNCFQKSRCAHRLRTRRKLCAKCDVLAFSVLDIAWRKAQSPTHSDRPAAHFAIRKPLCSAPRNQPFYSKCTRGRFLLFDPNVNRTL